MYGYSGKILHVDLKEKKNWVEEKPESWYKIYIGGVSMATRLCWENIEPGCDPLGPGNPICIANCWGKIRFGLKITAHRFDRRQSFRQLV